MERSHLKLWLVAAFIIIPMLLAGCGGSGSSGGSGATSPSPAPHTPGITSQKITLTAVAGSPTDVGISWAGSGTAGDGFQIYRDGRLIEKTDDDDGTAFDTGLTPGSEHCYQIAATGSAGMPIADSDKSCVTTAPLAGWDIQRVDEAPPVALALDSQGREHLSFCSRWSGVVYQARQADGSWTSTVIDPTANCFDALVAVGSGGSAYVIYADSGSDTLKYATDASGSWVVSTVPGAEGAEFYVLALDPADHVHVAFRLFTGQAPDCYQIIYATNASGTWQSQQVAGGDVYPSIAVDGDGMPYIAFLGEESADGSYPVHYLSDASGTWTDAIVAASFDPKSLVALAVDGAGHGYLAYKSHDDLEFASDNSGSWLGSKVETFAAGPLDDSFGDYDVSIALDSFRQPHISYQDSAGDLKYGSLGHDGWDTVYVDTQGAQNRLCLDAAGHAHITYAYTYNMYSMLAVSP